MTKTSIPLFLPFKGCMECERLDLDMKCTDFHADDRIVSRYIEVRCASEDACTTLAKAIKQNPDFFKEEDTSNDT